MTNGRLTGPRGRAVMAAAAVRWQSGRRRTAATLALMPRVSLPTGSRSPHDVRASEPGFAAGVMRVTQQDVARAAGVHNSTVSLALRGSPTISAATRERVRGIAASMGYTPDPAVQALVAYRIRMARRTATAALACVTDGASATAWKGDAAHAACFEGARERAAELGFTLDPFWAGESGLTQRRLSQILYHRSITGVVLLTEGGTDRPWDGLAWDRLCGVAISAREISPRIHRVTTDPAANMRLALNRARDAGYRRPGLVLPQVCDDSCDGAWSHGFAAEEARTGGGADAVPICRVRGTLPAGAEPLAPDEVEAERMRRWIERHRPDVLLGWNRWIRPLLDSLGLRVPRDVAFIDLDRGDAVEDAAGIRQHHRAIGAMAVDRVVHLLLHNLRGTPAVATRTLVEGTWCEGGTLPRCRSVPRSSTMAPCPDTTWVEIGSA